MKLFKIFVLLDLFFCCSCRAQQINKSLKAEGTVHKGIPVAADGCGATIQVGNKNFKAEDLPEDFLVEGLKVRIEYIKADTFYCGRGRAPIPVIRIRKIKRVN